MGEYGREPALSGQGDRRTHHQTSRPVVREYPARDARHPAREKASLYRHRCRTEPAGNLEYGRGNREPSFPQKRTQKIASDKQAPASPQTRLKKPGESAQTGGTPALPHHLLAG